MWSLVLQPRLVTVMGLPLEVEVVLIRVWPAQPGRNTEACSSIRSACLRVLGGPLPRSHCVADWPALGWLQPEGTGPLTKGPGRVHRIVTHVTMTRPL